MLIKNGWEAQAAIDGLLSDPDYIATTFKFTLEEGQKRLTEFNRLAEFTCSCCFCDYERSEAVLLEDCGHALCTYCYTGYLEAKLSAGPESVFAICPDTKCNFIVPERIWE